MLRYHLCAATVFTLLAAAAPAVAADPPAAPKRYAVAVGVNAYDHPRLPALSYAVNDATELAAVLRPAGYDVALLTDKTDTKPTKGNIEAAVRSALTRCRAGDTVVLAFAGHGVQFDGAADAYFCPSDARPSDNGKDSLVSLTKLYADLDDSFAGVKVLLVDACRDDPTPGRSARGVTADSAPRPPRGVAALFSCSAGERAFESPALKHGVFFHHVLQGLRGEAKNGRGQVTFNSLSDYVSFQVSDQTPRLVGGGAKQSPNQKADVSGASPVLMAAVSAASAPANTAAESPLEKGRDLLYGRGVKADVAAATRQFEAAVKADASDAAAMYHLSLAHRFGYGVKVDYAAAAEWSEKAVTAGNAYGLVGRATALRDGVGGMTDADQADRYDREARPVLEAGAAAGDPVAMNALGAFYRTGRGGFDKDDAKAADWFKKAAAAGDPLATRNLGTMHASGLGVPQDDKKALGSFKKAVAAGEPIAMSELGFWYATGREVVRDDTEAFQLFAKAAEAGVSAAMNQVGFMYENGRGAEKNDAYAVKWYREAARAGLPLGKANYGLMLEQGRGGLDKDDAEAARWYQEAANAGDRSGQHHLAAFYAAGRGGLKKDVLQAANLYKKSAEAGHPAAMNAMGVILENSNEDAKAVEWYRKAAAAGHPAGMNNFGFFYFEGRGGLIQDDKEAVKWYRKAAAAGWPMAYNNMGVMYRDGRGVDRDDREAVSFFKKAEAANNPTGTTNLGFMYEYGRGGLPKNLSNALWFYEKAAKLGDEQAKKNLVIHGHTVPQ